MQTIHEQVINALIKTALSSSFGEIGSHDLACLAEARCWVQDQRVAAKAEDDARDAWTAAFEAARARQEDDAKADMAAFAKDLNEKLKRQIQGDLVAMGIVEAGRELTPKQVMVGTLVAIASAIVKLGEDASSAAKAREAVKARYFAWKAADKAARVAGGVGLPPPEWTAAEKALAPRYPCLLNDILT